MVRGRGENSKIFYKGDNDDFIIFVEDQEGVKKWRQDKSIPLSHIMSGWGIYVTHRQGAQGIMDAASNSMLECEFGTSKEEEVIKQILEKGGFHETETSERIGITNETMGPRTNH